MPTVVLIGPQLEDNLSVGYLASSLEAAGLRTAVLRFDGPADADDVAARVARDGPAVVGISIPCQHRAREQQALAARLRETAFHGHIVLGGEFPTLAPATVLANVPSADSVLRGEAERSLVVLVRAVAAGGDLSTVPGLVVRRPDGTLVDAGPPVPIVDLDGLPPPVRPAPAARVAGLVLAPVVGSRGCHGACTFCSIHAFHRSAPGCPPLRLRSPENLAEELAQLYHDRSARLFLFHDDILLLPDPADTVARFDRVREALDRRGVGRIFAVVPGRPDLIDAVAVPRLRELIGLVGMYLGIESGSDRTLQHLGRGVDRATVLRALETVRACRLPGSTNYLLFEPDTRLNDVARSLELMRAFPEIPANFARADVYAGTPLHARLEASGRLTGSWTAPSYTIADPRAEVMFQATNQVFRDRAGSLDCLLNRAMSLAQRKEVLRLSSDAAEATGVVAEAERLIAEVSLDTVGHLEALLAWARRAGHNDRAATVRFVTETAQCVNAASAGFYARMTALSARITSLLGAAVA